MENAIEITGVHKGYPGFHLSDVTLQVPAGHVTGLIGPNGAGKTTLIKLILGTVQSDSGSVRVLGMDQSREGADIRARVGFVHEVPPYYDFLSGRRFARLLRPYYRNWDQHVFEELCSEFALPLAKRISAYSRGMRMKLALAIALCHRADILLMDEPTSGLDPVFRRELLDRLRVYLEEGGRTILFSTHITSDLESIADYVLLLRHGKLCLSESADTLRERWRIVKGGREDLSAGVRDLLVAVEEHAYGFTALTEHPVEVDSILGDRAAMERSSLGDLVYFVDKGRGGDA